MTRIIGCGNLDRGDDAAGILAARSLRARGLDAREFSGDILAMLDLFEGADKVVLIDAMQTGAAPGTISFWNSSEKLSEAPSLHFSTHSLSVISAIRLARTLGRLPAQLVVYGIEGRSFDYGCRPCSEVLDAVDRVVSQVA